MRHRYTLIGLACILAVVSTTVPAHGAVLYAATSVGLRRGITGQTEAQAVAALDNDDDVNFLVGSKRRRGVSKVIFDMRFEVQPNTEQMTMQYTGRTSVPSCSLRMFFYRWRDRRFKRVGSSVVTDVEALHQGATVNAKPFIRNNRMRARVLCFSKIRFNDLFTDRVRFIGEP